VNRTRRALTLVGLTAALAGAAPAQSALDHYDLAGAPAWRVELPLALAEVSGLAVAEDGRVYAHGDEQATIFRFDLATRRLAERFGLAGRSGLLHADFEDIQVVAGRLFLVTSAGVVYEGRVAGDGRLVGATRRTAGFGGRCEVEGMVWDPPTRSLLLLCKQVRSRRWRNQVVILAVSTETWRVEPEPRILVPEARLEAVTGAKRFSGSAIARHPRTGSFILLAGPQAVYAEIDVTGRVLGGGSLDRRRHRQPEGVAIAPDLTLLISDEAAGAAASITAYAYRR
jgi:hypothetical protein